MAFKYVAWGNMVISSRGERDFLFFFQKREKSPNWICLTAGSVGHGRLLLVSSYSAVPGFIGPFTNTRRQTWAKTSCVEQMGFFGKTFSWLYCNRHDQSNTDQHFKARIQQDFWYLFSPGVLWGILLQSSRSYPTCLTGPGCNYISSFLSSWGL